MTPELSNTLAAIAQKLGTSVEHLWPVLVAQTKFKAGIMLVASIAGILLGSIASCAFSRAYFQKDYDFIEDNLGPFRPVVIGVVALIACSSVPVAIENLTSYNFPEVAAIRQIMGK